MNAILNINEWAMIREALDMYRDELDAQWEDNAPADFVEPDLGLTAEDEAVADNCRTVEALLKILPTTGPVQIVGHSPEKLILRLDEGEADEDIY